MSVTNVDRYKGPCLIIPSCLPGHGPHGNLGRDVMPCPPPLPPPPPVTVRVPKGPPSFWPSHRLGFPLRPQMRPFEVPRFCCGNCSFLYEGGSPLYTFFPHRTPCYNPSLRSHYQHVHLPQSAPITWHVCSSSCNKDKPTSSNPKIQETGDLVSLDELAQNLPPIWDTRDNPKPLVGEREGSLSPPSSCDTVSVTSDEGSAGTSENVLPRIIKPRKRRKKDRKPQVSQNPAESGTLPQSDPTKSAHQCPSKTDNPCCKVSLSNATHCTSNCQLNKPCCVHCPSPFVFPTPPPSPAASVASSPPLSCASPQSEDEAGCYAPGWPPVAYSPDCRTSLVRSLSAPQTLTSAGKLNITSTVTQSFNGHREIDICLFTNSSEWGSSGLALPSRTRHWSSPSPPFTKPHLSGDSSAPAKSLGTLEEGESHCPNLSSHAVHTPAPNEREWINISEANVSRPTCIFTVMCYNVLCDKYATRQMYGYCPPWALEWAYRKKGIMEEVRRCAADIITLQEVETDQFYNYFLPELKKNGYDGIFSPKSRAKHMSESERKFVDGCAIFWKTSKFTLGKEHLIEFNQLAMANHDGSEDMLNRVMTKDNIVLAALLYTTDQAWGAVVPEKGQVRQPILVCNAHIHWDPEFCDVKLIQTIMLMSEVKSLVTMILEESRHRQGPKLDFNDIHLLLCGDLNSLPDSGVVEFLTKGSVSMDHQDFKGLGYKTSLQKIALSRNHNSGLVNTSANIYTHSFRLAATYDFHMPYTNYTYEFKGIIDYIFHNRSTIKTLGVLGPIDPDWFTENKVLGCPHPHIPSDHFPLLVELELQPSSNSNHQNGLLHR